MRLSPIRAENHRLATPRNGVEQRDAGDSPGEPDDDRVVLGQDALVDDVPQQQRVHHRDQRVQRGGDHEGGQRAAVGPRVGDDPADRPLLELLVRHGRVLPEGPHHRHARPRTVHACGNLRPAANSSRRGPERRPPAANRSAHVPPPERRSRWRSACAVRSAAACSSSVRRGAPASSFFVARAVAASGVSSAATRSATAASRSAPGTTRSRRAAVRGPRPRRPCAW